MQRAVVPDTAVLLSPARGRVRYPEAGCTLPFLCLKINELRGAAALPHFSQLIPNNLLQQRNFYGLRSEGPSTFVPVPASRRTYPYPVYRIRIFRTLPIRNSP